MTVLAAARASKLPEEKWGVRLRHRWRLTAVVGGGRCCCNRRAPLPCSPHPGAPVEEKTEFDVVLTESRCPEDQRSVKEVRAHYPALA